jgi:hypothetical protein
MQKQRRYAPRGATRRKDGAAFTIYLPSEIGQAVRRRAAAGGVSVGYLLSRQIERSAKKWT